MTTTTIDCERCPVRGRFCGDCFVPLLGRMWLGTPEVREPEETSQASATPEREPLGASVGLDSDELAAVGAFVRAGLVTPEEGARARAELTASGWAAG